MTININAAPEISVISPEDQSEYTRSETININFSIKDTSLHKAEIYVNNILIKTFSSGPFQYELNELDIGTYFIKFVAIDNYKLESIEKIKIKVINTIPAISIIEPAKGDTFEFGEEISFKASVIDEDEDVYKVAFYNEEGQIGSNANIFYETIFRNLFLGEHSIVAKAFDKMGAVGESDTVRITVKHPSSVPNANLKDEVSIYPNPLKEGNLTVELNETNISSNNIQISVTDITGKIVYKYSVNGFSSGIHITYDKFPKKGLYFISFQKGEIKLVKKLTIQ